MRLADWSQLDLESETSQAQEEFGYNGAAKVINTKHQYKVQYRSGGSVWLDFYKVFATKQELLEYLDGRVAKWWLPDDVVFIDEVPRTSVGKFSKKTLRDQFADYTLPTA